MKTPIVPGRLKLKQPGKSTVKQTLTKPQSKTHAEEAFQEAHRLRESARIDAHLQVTHKSRMEKYNQLLDSLPEHFDLPKSSSG